VPLGDQFRIGSDQSLQFRGLLGSRVVWDGQGRFALVDSNCCEVDGWDVYAGRFDATGALLGLAPW
jgi:hypothetical protein